MAEPTKKRISLDHSAALERLIRIAQNDTGQSRRVADFLLAWWNARDCGGFDLTDLWSVDSSVAQDMVEVVKLIAEHHNYPDTLGYAKELDDLVCLWRLASKVIQV